MEDRYLEEFTEMFMELYKEEHDNFNKCTHPYVLINDEQFYVCSECGFVVDDLVFTKDLSEKERSNYSRIRKIVPYSRNKYCSKRIRYLKGQQKAKVPKIVWDLVSNETNVDKVKKILKENKLSKYYTSVYLLIGVDNYFTPELENLFEIIYYEILRVYPTYKINKKKFFPWAFVASACMHILREFYPEYTENINNIIIHLSGYKVKSNFKKNYEVLKKCVSNLNFTFIYETMSQVVLFPPEEIAHMGDNNTFQLGQGHAVIEKARIDGISKMAGYALSEKARIAMLAFDNDLPLRIKSSENQQMLLGIEGRAAMGEHVPVTMRLQAVPMDESVEPLQGPNVAKAPIEPDLLLPFDSVQNLFLAKKNIKAVREQLRGVDQAPKKSENKSKNGRR